MSNRGLLSIDELGLLMPDSVFPSTKALEDFLQTEEGLKQDLEVVRGVVVPKDHGRFLEPLAPVDFAPIRLQMGRKFGAALGRVCPWVRLLAISGSTAYGRPKPEDDLDFFLVTTRRRMWITLLFSLVIAKIERLRDPTVPVYCFNRTLEDYECEVAFHTCQEPLFAREALNLKILRGSGYYQRLLRDATWMKDYFPKLFRIRNEPPVGSEPAGKKDRWNLWSIANIMALLGVGTYLWLLGLMRNHRFEKTDDHRGHQFRTVIRKAFCAYESQKYDELKEAYREAF